MTEESQNVSEKKPRSKRDFMPITEESMRRLDSWIEQASQRPGVNLTRRGLVNWLILSHPEELSSAEVRGLQEAFYDDEKLIKDAKKIVEEAKGRGEKLSLLDVLLSKKPSASDPKSRRKSKSSPDTDESPEDLSDTQDA